jgi:hypothetical protein
MLRPSEQPHLAAIGMDALAVCDALSRFLDGHHTAIASVQGALARIETGAWVMAET